MKKQLFNLLFILLGLLIIAGCGSGGGGNGGGGEDPPSTSSETATVSGTVLAANGLAISDAHVTISSTPITITTDANGYFSAEVNVGTHSIVIKRDTATIYEGSFTCSKDTSLDLGSMSTIYRPLPDTGQTEDSTDLFGEDRDYTINPPSFTNNGDGTVTDNVSGLMWQEYSLNETFNWWRASGTYDAHNPDTQDVCKSLTTGGHNDWRLPDYHELMGIVNYGISRPAIDSNVFPDLGTELEWYWSSSETIKLGANGQAFRVDFKWGQVKYINKTDKSYVRCVRGGQGTEHSFTAHGDGTVTDNVTGLMWQQQDDNTARSLEEAIAYCERQFPTYNDWRLPNIKELGSISDNSQYNLAIDSTAFPHTNDTYYWSSTTYTVPDDAYAWYVNFRWGEVRNARASRDDKKYVRCVRGGESLDFFERPLCGSTPYNPLTQCCNHDTGDIMEQYNKLAMTECPNTKVAKPPECFEPTTDGCSIPIPDWIPIDKNHPVLCNSSINFFPACEGHDFCYKESGRTKENCDSSFLTSMTEICSKYISDYTCCMETALAMYIAVKEGANRQYENGQNNASQCCSEPLQPLYFEKYGKW